ncbi:amidohydrolase family protein [Micromonospora sp. CA-240977]|uniref:amidohydrolase family protein n=1 Tax=Micromonospora sp. CA-240977 TaxID=3239957 RepID=UPI003D8FA0AD
MLGRLLSTMDDCGLDRAVVCAGGTLSLDQLSRQLIEGGHVETDADNEAVLRAADAADGRLVPFYFGNPHAPAARYRAVADQYTGLEISPAVHGVPLTDERNLRLLAIAAEAGHPAYVVCLERPGARVTDLVELARRFPGLSLVLGHSGVGNIDYYAVDLIAPYPSIALETSGGYSSVVRRALDRLGPGRVLFGSEFPLQDPRVELAKYAALDLPPAQWAQVAWDNADRLLGGHPRWQQWRRDDNDRSTDPAATAG